MVSVIPYMLRQTIDNRPSPCSFHLFSPLTVTFPKLSYFASTITRMKGDEKCVQILLQNLKGTDHMEHLVA